MGRQLVSDLLTIGDLPPGFHYPSEFVRVVELGLTNLEPWWILQGEVLRVRQTELIERYPSRKLVVFAARQDRDDVACWDLETHQIAIIHDYASPGFEQVENLDDFSSWLRRAVHDLIEFGE